ncbi:MBL fold metallo-hydrolase [Phosphitispora fastidiosa]|uniref:MBL fold metallo-hydrolase n=1 Tax=Phosphitispora fastidiosa TaxID=2837202 RepID=UPI001E3ABF46|nr:MBL fold metallo-hydrolase [Phosphitispora fastidiosa]MBU7008110.1 glyoxylase-like metal-dependent hydrolase (beta-lactamase superfamily II) [Phosphitispora fastidiosa]
MPYRIAPDIYVYQSSMWQTNSAVIINQTANLVIDPCYFPAEIRIIADFVNRKRSFNRYMIFTHSDFDHIVGYQNFKNYKLVAHEEFAFCDRDSQLIQLNEIDQSYYVLRTPPFVFPDPEITFQGTYRISISGDELLLVHAPGHTGDCIFVISLERGIMFAGDYLSNLEFPFVNFSTAAYKKTLDLAGKLVRDHNITCVVPGHGDIADGREEIFDRIESDREYLVSLTEWAQDLFVQGLQTREITEVLSGLPYRNRPIEGVMLKMHIENIKLVISELQSF